MRLHHFRDYSSFPSTPTYQHSESSHNPSRGISSPCPHLTEGVAASSTLISVRPDSILVRIDSVSILHIDPHIPIFIPLTLPLTPTDSMSEPAMVGGPRPTCTARLIDITRGWLGSNDEGTRQEATALVRVLEHFLKYGEAHFFHPPPQLGLPGHYSQGTLQLFNPVFNHVSPLPRHG